jgi:hypothetical protein
MIRRIKIWAQWFHVRGILLRFWIAAALGLGPDDPYQAWYGYFRRKAGNTVRVPGPTGKDDTVMIQAAIDAASRIIGFPEGKYKITEPIQASEGKTIVGFSWRYREFPA